MSMSRKISPALPMTGNATAGPITLNEIGKVEAVGQLLRGEIRKLEFTSSGDLILLTGLGLSILRGDQREFETLYPEHSFAWFGLSSDALVLAVPVPEEESVYFFKSSDYGPLEPVEIENYNDRMRSFGISQKGDLALPGSTEVEMWMADGENFFFPFPDRVDATFSEVQMSEDGKYVSARVPGRFFGLWSTESGEPIYEVTRQIPSHSTFLPGDRILTQSLKFNASGSKLIHRVRNLLDWDGAVQLVADSAGTFTYGFDSLRFTDLEGRSAPWDSDTLQPEYASPPPTLELSNPPPVYMTAIGPSGYAVYDVKSGRLTVHRETTVVFEGFYSQLRGFRVSTSGEHIAVAPMMSKKALFFDLDKRTSTVVESESMTPLSLALDSERLAWENGNLGAPGKLLGLSTEGEVRDFHSLPNLSRAHVLGRDSYAIAAAFPDGGEVSAYSWGDTAPRVRMRADLGSVRELHSNHQARKIGVSWADGTSIFQLEDGSLLETLGACKALALGGNDNLAWYDGSQLNIRFEAKTIAVAVERPERGGLRLCFSQDDSVLILGTNRGFINFYSSQTGELLRTERAHQKEVVKLEQRCGLVYSLGGESILKIWGVPGGEKAPPLNEPLLPGTLDFGVQVKPEKRAWGHLNFSDLTESIFLSLRDGRSATFAEVSLDLSRANLQAALEGSAWSSCETQEIFWIKNAQWDAEPSSLPEPTHRIRLHHPVYLEESERANLREDYPNQIQWKGDCHIPGSPEDLFVSPSEFGQTKLSNERVLDLLKGVGFQAHRDSQKATSAWLHQAPELGAVAILDFYETRGHLEGRFFRWNGELDGAEALTLGQVNPQLYSELVEMMRECQ